MILMTLTAILSSTVLLTRNAYCYLHDPQVEVIPSGVIVGQEVFVKASIILSG